MQTIEHSFYAYKSRPSKRRLNALLKFTERFVYNICKNLLKHHQNAEDAAQIALVKMLDRLDTVNDFKHFSNLLYKITRHACINSVRTLNRRKIREEKAREILYEDRGQAQRLEIADLINEHLDRLDNNLKNLVSAYYFDGTTIANLSKRRGCSPSTICNHLSEAKNQLRKSMLAKKINEI